MSDFFGVTVPFIEHCGIHGVEHGKNWTVTEVSIQPELTNSIGIGHGGLIMTLLDVTMGSAARLSEPNSKAVLTIDLHTSFFRPAKSRVVCRAEVTSRTAHTAFCEASVYDSESQLIARGMATFKLIYNE